MKYNFNNIFRGIEEGYISIWSKDGGSKFFLVKDWSAAESYMNDLATRTNAYFNPSVFQDLPDRGRGTAQDVSYVTLLTLDWDVKVAESGIHAKNELLPESLEEILAIVQASALPMPTAIINSGNGFYGRYHLTEPFKIQSEADRLRAKNMSTGFQRAFIKAFAGAGRHMDQTADLVRVTRNPGTFNHKSDPAKPVTLVEYVPDRTYSMEALEAFVQPEDMRKNKPSTRRAPQRKSTSTSVESKRPDFDAVAAGCGFVDYCLANAQELAEPEWRALGSLMVECEDGAQLFHEVSAEDPRYSEVETQGKLDRLVGPMSCNHIREDLAFGGCAMCPQNGHAAMTSPVQFGHRTRAAANLLGKYAQVLGTREYVDVNTGHRIPYSEFTDKHMAFTQKSPHEMMNRDMLTRKVDVVDYLPGCFKRYVEGEGKTGLNIWAPSTLQSAAGDCSIILEHFGYLISEVLALEHLLDMLAHAVQKPSSKVRHVAMIRGKQGTGKTFLGNLVRVLFGEANTISVAGENLLTRWTAGMGNKQVLLWEESGVGSQLEAYERLKPWITDEMADVEQKHMPMYQARTPRIIVGFTNQIVPIKISRDDRRFMLISSSAEPREGSYYERLWGEGLAQASAFLHYLGERDISGFNPDAPPPDTAAKRELIDASRPALVREIQGMIDEAEYPFDRDLFTREELLRAAQLRVAVRANLSGSALVHAMEELGFINLRQVRLGASGSKPRLWAWRDLDRWQNASPGEVRAAYRPRLGPV